VGPTVGRVGKGKKAEERRRWNTCCSTVRFCCSCIGKLAMASHSSLALREISSAWCGKQTAISANKIQTKAHFVVGYVNPAAEDWLIAHVAHEEDDPCVRYMLRKFCFPSSPTAPPPLSCGRPRHSRAPRRGSASKNWSANPSTACGSVISGIIKIFFTVFEIYRYSEIWNLPQWSRLVKKLPTYLLYRIWLFTTGNYYYYPSKIRFLSLTFF